jgi:hypothetical protein
MDQVSMLILNASLTNFNPASLPVVYLEQQPGFTAADIAFRQQSRPSYLQSHFLFHIHYLGCRYLNNAGDRHDIGDYAFSRIVIVRAINTISFLASYLPVQFKDWLENIISKPIDVPLTKGACEDDPCCKQCWSKIGAISQQ